MQTSFRLAFAGAALGLSTLLASCGGGGSDPAPPVAAVPLAITSFTATPANANAGDSVVLAWQTAGASTLSIDQGVGVVTGSSVSVKPALGATTYELTASDGSSTLRRSVGVSVAAAATAPVIASFTASATSISAGQMVSLSWSVTGASTLTLSPLPGAVSGTTATVTPSVSTVYTLTASNATGSADSSVAVAVATAPAGFIERTLAASSTGSGIADTFGSHVVEAPTGSAVGRLFVHLPGSYGKPSNSLLVLRQAASEGLHAIGLAYPNVPTVDSLCSASSDAACYEKVRLEIIDGTDRTPLIAIDRANSIENRLALALASLAAVYPAEGWSQYLAGGAPRWDRIVISGHSQGGGHAALMARDRTMARVCLFASPKDFSDYFHTSAAWQTPVHLTPVSRYYGFNHQQDSQAATLLNWAALGMATLGAPASVDAAAPPYASSHQLTTNAAPAVAGAYHGSVVVDRNTPLLADGTPLFKPVWSQMCFQ